MAATVCGALFAAGPAAAHDIELQVEDLKRNVASVEATIEIYRRRPVFSTAQAEDPRWALGRAEIDLALGNLEAALRGVLSSAEDPAFRASDAYAAALLLAAEILERSGEDFGAMEMAEKALHAGRRPLVVAEAGARWFRLARRHQRAAQLVEIYRLMETKGGLEAADADLGGQARYEAAFALRERGALAEARALLSDVASESTFGSRAAYLAGVLFVEEGNLSDAERWFAALSEWSVPPRLSETVHQAEIEGEVRDLAALSAARLRYERGALEDALVSYERVRETSPHFEEACWELAYLTLEMERPGSSLEHLGCVRDLGPEGRRVVDAELFAASLSAHLRRYEDSLRAYGALFDRYARQQEVFDAFLADVQDPARFLFQAMERSAVASVEPPEEDLPEVFSTRRRVDPSPGPATLFADAWTTGVDQAYRVDAGLSDADQELASVSDRVALYLGRLTSADAFPQVQFRRRNMERLLLEIEHQLGHAGRMGSHGGRAAASEAAARGHPEVEPLRARLRNARDKLRQDLQQLEVRAQQRLVRTRSELNAVRRELSALERDAEELRARARAPTAAAARAALRQVQGILSDASLRAEAGVLDTFWLKKQQRTRDIEELLRRKGETEAQAEEAVDALSNL